MDQPKPQSVSIPAGPPADVSMDFEALRKLSLEHLARLGSAYWTDYNPTDPGITILEILIYALTDLGYRANFPIEDILAEYEGQGGDPQHDDQFFTARTILSSAPVTLEDMRKKIIDISGINNAWIFPVTKFSYFKGLRRIVLLLNSSFDNPENRKKITQNVQEVFLTNRNLGEDLEEISFLKTRELFLELELFVEPGVSPEQMVADIIIRLETYLESRINFLTLAQIQAQFTDRVDAIFEGPALEHGFIPEGGLIPKLNKIRSIDLINQVRDLAGIKSISRMNLISDPWQPREEPNLQGIVSEDFEGREIELVFDENECPILGNVEKFRLSVSIGQQKYNLNTFKLIQGIKQAKALRKVSKQASMHEDLPVPGGKFRNLQEYFSVQYDFPVMYGLLPGALKDEAEFRRIGTANQLKGLLTIFDQILANFLSQLSNLSRVFSWSEKVQRTYFFQGLENASVDFFKIVYPGEAVPRIPYSHGGHEAKGFSEKELNYVKAYQGKLAIFQESEYEFIGRRGKFLEHLLARFGRNLTDYIAHLPYSGSRERGEYKISANRNFLATFPALSSDRGQGGDPFVDDQHPSGLPGLERVISTIFDLAQRGGKYDGDYRRVEFARYSKIPKTRLLGNHILEANDGKPIDMPYLLRIGTNYENYTIQPPEVLNGGFSFNLSSTSETDGSETIYSPVNTFLSAGDADQAIWELIENLEKFDRASERIYAIDHILLRPPETDPLFGISLLSEQGAPLLGANGWLPRPLLEVLQEINPENSQLIYSDEQLPEAQEDEFSFVFRLQAVRGSDPFPAFPATGMQMKGTFKSNSRLTETEDISPRFRDYILQFYSDLLDQPTLLGQALQEDFLQPDLPPDWRNPARHIVMQEWGKAALRTLIANRKTAANSTLGDSLAKLGKETGRKDEEGFLAQWLNGWYSPLFTTPALLEEAVNKDLKKGRPANKKDLSQAVNSMSREFWACLGRKVVEAYLRREYPRVVDNAASFGAGIRGNLNLYPKDFDVAETAKWVAQRLVLAWKGIQPNEKSPPDAGPQSPEVFLVNLIKTGLKIEVDLQPGFRKLLVSSGREFLGRYMQSVWKWGLFAPDRLGVNLLLYHREYRKKYPAGNTKRVFKNLVEFAEDQLMGYLEKFYLPQLDEFAQKGLNRTRTLPQPGANLGNAMQSDLLKYARTTGGYFDPGEPGKEKKKYFLQCMLDAFIWLTRYKIAPLGSELPGLEGFELEKPVLPANFEELGRKALIFYLEKNYLSRGNFDSDNFEGLGQHFESLQIVNKQGVRDALVAIGAYFQANFLNHHILSGTKQGETLFHRISAWVDANITDKNHGLLNALPSTLDWGNKEKEKLAIQLFELAMSMLVDNLPLPLIPLSEPGSPPKEDVTPPRGPDLPNFVRDLGTIHLKYFLKEILAMLTDSNDISIKNFNQLVRDNLLVSSKVNRVDPRFGKIWTENGQFLMHYFLGTKYAWQMKDGISLYQAIIHDLNLPLNRNLSFEEKAKPPEKVEPEKIKYGFSLACLPPKSKEWLPENLEAYRQYVLTLTGKVNFTQQSEAEEEIEKLIFRIQQVRNEDLPFENVFQTRLKPLTDQKGPFFFGGEDHISNQITVVMPDWPTRFQDSTFKEAFRKALTEECPAHIFCNLLELSFPDFQIFEEKYLAWKLEDPGEEDRGYYSSKLLEFILSFTHSNPKTS
ncbi:MAG: hypothetical protein H6581_15835 [Bacteroidia bacterium]|nr:hypothetical protein [Bacteroidia bacterium]